MKFLREFISHYSKPFRVIRDHGTALIAHCFEEFCKNHDIIHVKVASGTPRGNGQIERLNKTILSCLSSVMDCEAGERLGL